MNALPVNPSTSTTLSAQLRAGTRDLHARTERSGIMPGLLRGEVQRASYCVLLRNLHAIYAALEAALTEHAADALVAPIHDPLLWRRTPLQEDLDVLYGVAWRDLAITGATADCVAHIARADPPKLVAHAYVRYLGDLSGGQVLARIVQGALNLEGTAGTRFYRFAPEDATTRAHRFRHDLDTLPVSADLVATIVDEARWAFSMHVRLFEELAAS